MLLWVCWMLDVSMSFTLKCRALYVNIRRWYRACLLRDRESYWRLLYLCHLKVVDQDVAAKVGFWVTYCEDGLHYWQHIDGWDLKWTGQMQGEYGVGERFCCWFEVGLCGWYRGHDFRFRGRVVGGMLTPKSREWLLGHCFRFCGRVLGKVCWRLRVESGRTSWENIRTLCRYGNDHYSNNRRCYSENFQGPDTTSDTDTGYSGAWSPAQSGVQSDAGEECWTS